ncbi:alginate O-acetyltransferase AlgX-related protein [Phaeocystidibacter luteus]|uniref:alginate O-acetyltransferase AlgX-related protein n=1 Tax=Phaeocystidibacter luteus TaxID=911197 RepID=UPI0014790121|nr:hypothetical protein [Phaeocystidibacter luteus]
MKRTYNIAFILVFTAFAAAWIPLGKELKGVTNEIPKAEFSLHNVFSEEFQEASSKQIVENLPARPFLVRAHNQIKFQLYSETNAEVIVGKNRVLFEQNYLDEYADLNPLSDDEVQAKVDEIEAWTVRAREAGAQPYLMIVPSKPEYFEEAIPSPWTISETTNIDRLHGEFKRRNLPIIDLRETARALKDTSQFSVFPKYGIHWSNLTSAISLTQFLNVIDTLSAESDYSASFSNVRSANSYSESETDLGNLLNLLTVMDLSESVGQLDLDNSVEGEKHGLLVVGDSFYWTWYGNGYTTTQFEPSYFFYYNSTAYKAGEGEIGSLTNELRQRILQEVDIAVIMLTEANWRSISLP